MAKELNLTQDINVIKKDRMRFTKNTLSATLCYLAILFNVFYFVDLYSTNIGSYYYNYTMGLSVLYNLLFLLFTFLCSEGVKNYGKGHSVALVVIGALQIVRIFDIPAQAHSATISLGGVEQPVMSDGQFTRIVVFLVVSAACCIIAGVIGFIRTTILENYKKETGLS